MAFGHGPHDVFYGFPRVDGDAGLRAIKIATEQCETSTTPDEINRHVSPKEIASMFEHHIRGRLCGVTARCVKAATCLDTNVARANFLIDRLAHAPDVIVVSACSGHGFKHSAAISEAIAAMAISGEKPEVLRPFVIPAN